MTKGRREQKRVLACSGIASKLALRASWREARSEPVIPRLNSPAPQFACASMHAMAHSPPLLSLPLYGCSMVKLRHPGNASATAAEQMFKFAFPFAGSG